MKLLEALARMYDETRIDQIRLPEEKGIRKGKPAVVRPEVIIKKEDFRDRSPARICLGPELSLDTWEIGWTCQRCWGEGGDCLGEDGKPCTNGVYWTDKY